VRASAAVAFALLTLAAAGCGSGTGGIASGDADKSRGKQLFTERCGACHTLSDAKTMGKIGPNLDNSFRPDRRQGFSESTIRQVVADQIKFAANYGDQGPTMPDNLVTGDNVDDVAAYVAYVAGEPGKTVSAAQPPPPPATKPPAGGGGGGALAAGKQAFTSNGCGACHTYAPAGSNGKVGPDLDNLKSYASKAGKPLQAFTHESIVAPNDYIEPGYPKGVMPSTFGSLPKSTIDALVAFLTQSK
jgi:cytochrome c2